MRERKTEGGTMDYTNLQFSCSTHLYYWLFCSEKTCRKTT